LELLEPGNDQFAQRMGGQWLAQVAYVRREDGVLIDFFPVTTNDLDHEPIELPESLRAYVKSPRAVLDALYIDASLPSEAYKKALTQLGAYADWGQDAVRLKLGQRLLIPSEIAFLLAGAEVLSALFFHFHVEILQEDWAQLQDDLAKHENAKRWVGWLRDLIDRISAGLDKRRYQLIPTPDTGGNPETESEIEGLAMEAVTELLKFEAKEGDLIWSDDRWFNAFLHRDRVPIVGITEVLETLRAMRRLQDETYFGTLLRLRAGNFRFIPLTQNEITYWLAHAPIIHGEVGETAELRILRQYWSACLLATYSLQIPAPHPEAQGEIPFLLHSQRAIRGSLASIWSDRRLSKIKKRARAQWVLDNLYVDFIRLRHFLPEAQDKGNRPDISGLDLFQLLVTGWDLDPHKPGGPGDQPPPQAQFLDWVIATMVEPRLKADPGSARTVAYSLRNVLSEMFERMEGEHGREGVSALRQRASPFIQKLSVEIREELHKDVVFMERMGLAHYHVVTLFESEEQFQAEAFWDAVYKAVNRGIGQVEAIGKRKTFSVQRVDRSDPDSLAIELVSRKGPQPRILRDPMVGVLSNRADIRLQTLKSHPEWFDGECSNLATTK
jgi:hypothetical protein